MGYSRPIDEVGAFSAKEIGRTAKERKAGSSGYAESMLIAYNKKMKSPLQWSKLYKTNAFASNDISGFDEDDA